MFFHRSQMYVIMHYMIRMFLMFLVSCYLRERDSLPWCGEDSSLSLGFWRFSIDLGVVPLRQLTNKNNEQRVKNIEPLKTKIQIPSTEIRQNRKESESAWFITRKQTSSDHSNESLLSSTFHVVLSGSWKACG